MRQLIDLDAAIRARIGYTWDASVSINTTFPRYISVFSVIMKRPKTGEHAESQRR